MPKKASELCDPIGEARSNIKGRWRTTYEKAMNSRSRKLAIKAFCQECVGWQAGEVAKCTDKGCPLYKFRRTG